MAELSGLRIAAVAGDGVEEAELTKPVQALKAAGATVHIISPNGESIQAFDHLQPSQKIEADRALGEVHSDDYDALVLPGGALNADALRVLPEVQTFVRAFQEAGKPIASICHAPWILISTNLVLDRTLTSYHTIQDDIRNAGGRWEDREVVEDGNWVSSRQPSDIPAFLDRFFGLLRRIPALQR